MKIRITQQLSNDHNCPTYRTFIRECQTYNFATGMSRIGSVRLIQHHSHEEIYGNVTDVQPVHVDTPIGEYTGKEPLKFEDNTTSKPIDLSTEDCCNAKSEPSKPKIIVNAGGRELCFESATTWNNIISPCGEALLIVRNGDEVLGEFRKWEYILVASVFPIPWADEE